MKIYRHPKNYSAEGLLRELAEESRSMESVAVIIQYNDGSYGKVWSNQSIKELTFKKELLDQSVRELLDE